MKKSIIQLQEVNDRFDARIDAEFFQPHYKQIDKLLNKHNNCELKELAYKITDGTHYTPSYVLNGIPFLSAINVKENILDLDCGYQYISEEEHKTLYRRCAPKANDILLRKVGVGPRYATVVPYNIPEFSLFVSVALIKSINICPYYLSTFINSYYGQIQLLRFNKGISQPDLHLEDIATLKVPLFKENFSNLIEKTVKESYKNRQTQIELYNSSQQIILQELNILNWQPKQELSYVKNFSDVNSANRCDAEYFQPKYDEIIEKIKSYPNGWDTVENILEINDKNITPKDNEEYRYIELSNISNNGEITGATIDIGENLPTRARRFVEAGELIVSSIEGSLDSIALVTAEYSKSFCSNGFYVLKSDFYNSETLLCLLKSIIGQMQLKKGCSGTILTAISKEELNKIILPKISIDIQNQVKDNIQKMYKLKYQSKQLLEIAKRGVEIAIEENEEVATSWINEQLSKIGVVL